MPENPLKGVIFGRTGDRHLRGPGKPGFPGIGPQQDPNPPPDGMQSVARTFREVKKRWYRNSTRSRQNDAGISQPGVLT